MSNWLIVESKNDQLFFQALIEHLNLQHIQFNTPICHVDEFECMDGLSDHKLINSLNRLKNKLAKDDIKAIGILLDNDGKAGKRVQQVNKAIEQAFGHSSNLVKSGDSTTFSFEVAPNDVINLRVSFFLVGVEDTGELETVLRVIHTQPATYANCLNTWRSCLAEEGKSISNKDFDKFWISNYLRYDTCSVKERKQAHRKCSMYAFEYVMENKHHIWDFDHEVLTELKYFLNSFVRD